MSVVRRIKPPMLIVAVYVGENASLSFLQFVRRMLKKYMGPSPFTENQFKENMLEIEMQRDESPVITDLSRGDKFALIQLYREAVSIRSIKEPDIQ